MAQSPPLRTTERRNPASLDLDRRDAGQLVDLFVAEESHVAQAVAAARSEIAEAMEHIEAAFRSGGRLFYVGAGTSGRLGVLDASECPPTFGTDPEMVQGIIAGGRDALVRSVEGAEDDAAAGATAIDGYEIGVADVVMGIAASGSTPFVRAALMRARERRATTMLLACTAPPAEMTEQCKTVIVVEVGPELLTGSTRLKAGTATKLVLNMLTTGAMVRLGKTWGNLMVDLRASNAKLRERGERLVMRTTNVDRHAARNVLEAAGGSVRTAIVMIRLQVDRATAESRLLAAKNRLRDILGDAPVFSDE